MIREEHGWCRLLFCLVFVLLIAAGWMGSGYAEDEERVLNASGNLNRALSVDPIENEEGYSAILYDNRNGLPTSEANAIAQSEEGFIWIGTYAGLIRYDGNAFERIESPNGILNTRCLYLDSQNRLWIGTNDFGVFVMQRDALRRVDQPDQLASVSIRSIAEDTNGLIYVASAAGVATVDASLELTVIEDPRISAETIQEIRTGKDGLIYGNTVNGDLFALKDGKVQDFLCHDECGLGSIQAILPDPNQAGVLYLAIEAPETKTDRILRGTPEDRFASAEIYDVSPLSGVQSMEMMDGQLWLCAVTGIGKLTDDGFHLLKNVPMDKSVVHVMTDYEGNLWFASTRQCVMKIVPNRFLDLFERFGLAPKIVNSTCLCGRQLFIGTDSGLTVLEDGKTIDRLPLTTAVTASGEDLEAEDLLSLLQGVRIRSIIRDSKGRLWISTFSPLGLVRYDQGNLMAFTDSDGMISQRARTVCELEDGSILVAQPDGVSVITGDAVGPVYGTDSGLVVPGILTVAEGFNHELILGSDGGGIYIIGADGTRHIGVKEGLKSEVILRIKRSQYRDVFWIATGNSIAYMTPDYRVTTVDHFPYSNNYDFYESSRGDLWVLSSNGIYVVSTEAMLENGPIETVFFGIPSGLPYIATANSFSEMTDDGDLYIAGVNGTIRVNIEKPFDSFSNLRIAMPYIDIDEERIYPNESGVFSIPSNVRKVTIHPYIFNYALVDPVVSYRLSGFDTADTMVNRSELGPVTYTNLREGTYSFDLKVTDPISDEAVSFSYPIVKDKVISIGGAGSIIIDAASLFFMSGLLIYTALYRKRGRLDDRLFFALIIVNMALALADALTYLLNGSGYTATRSVMMIGNIVFYAAFEIFPYLYMLYLHYRVYKDKERCRKVKLWLAFPCLAILILIALSPLTGWIFSVDAEGTYESGPLNNLVFVPVLFYFVISLIWVRKINKQLVLLGILLIAARVALGVWFRDISSTSLTYTLFLVCTHIHVMNHPLIEEEL